MFAAPGVGVPAADEGRADQRHDVGEIVVNVRKGGEIVVGGADGLADSVRKRARLLLSLGAMTWPHMLVRGLLAEQLYRAVSILQNHPYHRE